jgi:hypothetical protein
MDVGPPLIATKLMQPRDGALHYPLPSESTAGFSVPLGEPGSGGYADRAGLPPRHIHVRLPRNQDGGADVLQGRNGINECGCLTSRRGLFFFRAWWSDAQSPATTQLLGPNS